MKLRPARTAIRAEKTAETFFVVFAAIMIGWGLCSADAADVIWLAGSGWFLHDAPGDSQASGFVLAAPSRDRGWIQASVPGNIQGDLEVAHRLDRLWYGAGDPRLYKVPLKDWWYRKDFFLPVSMQGKLLRLVFDGVDDTCDVYVNGHRVGGNAGMFLRFGFDVTKWLRLGQTNHLAVLIDHIPKILQRYVIESGGSPLQATPGTPNYFPTAIVKTREVLHHLKSTTNFGWDWGMNIWTLGIWKGVYLEATGPAYIKWTQIQTKLENNYHRAIVITHLTIDSQKAIKAQLTLKVSGHHADVLPATLETNLKPGINRVVGCIVLDHPALWWPNGQGTQPLYRLHARLTTDSGVLLDSRTTVFGVREIRWELVEGAPTNFVNRFRLLVNGRPVRMLGSNLVPPDLLFGRIIQRGLSLLYRAKAAGMNALRVWGGGVILPQKMYDLADHLGIMLMQEFPLSIDPIQTDPLFLSNLQETADDVIRQIRNHPSIIEWTGGNELSWRHGCKAQAYLILKRAVAQEDNRLFRPTSPIAGSTHGAYWFEAMPSDYAYYNNLKTMCASEFGTQSPANLNVWLKTIPPSARWPIHRFNNPILLHKNVVQAVFLPQLWLNKPVIDKVFGPPANLRVMVREGQMLGADGLRYAIDALRQKGATIGGILTWDFNEPWPNGAGSYMVGYYGQPLMNYDFIRQAYAPISLSLRYNSMFYDPAKGLHAQLMLVGDAPAVRHNLHWQWWARDRRGKVFDGGQGVISISPQQVITLARLAIHPPAGTARGPIFLELQLASATGEMLTERVEIFAAVGYSAPLAGLLDGQLPVADDDNTPPAKFGPVSKANLAYIGNGARPATASSALPGHPPANLNDGRYGDRNGWIATTPHAWFQIDLGKLANIGQFRLGRDRTNEYQNRGVDALQIEVSTDDQHWKTVFKRSGLTLLTNYNPDQTMIIDVTPVRARYVRGTVDSRLPSKGPFVCIDEFEVYKPQGKIKGAYPRITFENALPPLNRSVRRARLRLIARSLHGRGCTQVLELTVTNTSPMTALFCRPQPLLAYRTDLYIGNRNVCIPPAQSRTFKIRAPHAAANALSLGETGWRITSWNANSIVIKPSANVLLWVGRHDHMCQEFKGMSDASTNDSESTIQLTTTQPRVSARQMPYLLTAGGTLQIRFNVPPDQADDPAHLLLYTSDQSKVLPAAIVITVNGERVKRTLPRGLGVQQTTPAQLAFPGSERITLPAKTLTPGDDNTLTLHVAQGWLTWDAIDLLTAPPHARANRTEPR